MAGVVASMYDMKDNSEDVVGYGINKDSYLRPCCWSCMTRRWGFPGNPHGQIGWAGGYPSAHNHENHFLAMGSLLFLCTPGAVRGGVGMRNIHGGEERE